MKKNVSEKINLKITDVIKLLSQGVITATLSFRDEIMYDMDKKASADSCSIIALYLVFYLKNKSGLSILQEPKNFELLLNSISNDYIRAVIKGGVSEDYITTEIKKMTEVYFSDEKIYNMFEFSHKNTKGSTLYALLYLSGFYNRDLRLPTDDIYDIILGRNSKYNLIYTPNPMDLNNLTILSLNFANSIRVDLLDKINIVDDYLD